MWDVNETWCEIDSNFYNKWERYDNIFNKHKKFTDRNEEMRIFRFRIEFNYNSQNVNKSFHYFFLLLIHRFQFI